MSTYRAICKVCRRPAQHRINGECEDCGRTRRATKQQATKASRRKGENVTVAEAFRLLNEGKAWVRH